MPKQKKMYSVNLWCSEPGTNDDCETGDDFQSLSEALQVFANPAQHFTKENFNEQFHVELAGPGIYKTRVIGTAQEHQKDDKDWEREQAMQNGMAFGVNGYNDTFGY